MMLLIMIPPSWCKFDVGDNLLLTHCSISSRFNRTDRICTSEWELEYDRLSSSLEQKFICLPHQFDGNFACAGNYLVVGDIINDEANMIMPNVLMSRSDAVTFLRNLPLVMGVSGIQEMVRVNRRKVNYQGRIIPDLIK